MAMILPDHIVEKIADPAERRRHVTQAQAEQKAFGRLEREEHGIFENWLHLHGFAYRHSRTDKATRETCGAPDFTVYEKAVGFHHTKIANCLAIEFKLPGNKMSEAQEEWAAKYGGIVHILATAQAAIDLIKREFGE